ncbi:MAG: hypothetical protein AAGC88_01980 [Bacteroidota bacterium]
MIDFKTADYFPWTFKFLGGLLVIGALVAFTKPIILGLGLLILALIFLTTYHRLSIDQTNKQYKEYIWVLGMKKGEWKPFEKIDYLFINKKSASQKMNMESLSNTIRKPVYDAYLRFSEDHKLFVGSSESKSSIINKLKPIADQLDVELIDYDEP